MVASAEDLKKRLETTLRVGQLLTVCFMLPIFMYPLAVVAALGQDGVGPGFHGHSRMESSLVVIVCVALILGTPRITEFFLKRVLKQQLTHPDNSKLIAAYLMTITLSGALREVVALVGMILSIVERNLFWCVLLGVMAFFSLARNWPSRADLQMLFPQVRL